MGMKKGRIFYGWYIVAAGFLVMFCSIGIVNNCSGLYIKPVCDDMGFSRGAMGVNMTILSACQMIVALFGGKIFVRFDVRNIMRISSIALAVSYFSYSFVQSLPMYYALSVVLGFAGNKTAHVLTGAVFSALLADHVWKRRKAL